MGVRPPAPRRCLRCCLWLVLILTGWGASAQERPLEKVRLQLKWQHQFQFAGYYAAVEQGYYREAGLEVELIEAVPERDPVQAVLTGEAEFGVGNSDLLLLRAAGHPVVVLAAIFQHSPLLLVTRAASGVTDLQGLHDREMMMIDSEKAELFAYFKYEGIDVSRLRVRPHTLRMDDFIEGRVDAMSAYSTDEPFELRQAGVEFLAFTARSGGIDFYGDNLFTTEEQIRLHPERVRAFRAASLRGWEYALEHREEIVDLIRRHYPDRLSRDHLVFEAAKTAELMHPGIIEVGHINPGRWRHIADTYAEFGMLPVGFDLDGFLYDPDPKPDLRWLYWALAGLAALAVGAFAWVLPLRRLNRRLHQSEKQYRELTENAPFPVALTDLETHRVLFANRRIGEMLQLAPDAVVGKPAAAFYHNPADREALLAAVRAGRSATDFEVSFRAGDGRIIWTLLSAGLVDFNGRRAMMVAFNDISQRREMERELHRAKEAAEAANAAKGRYLAVLSHEIRTPVSGILGLVGIMLTEPLAGEQRENLEIMERSAQSLLRLVGDVLDWSQLEEGRVELEETAVPVETLVRDLAALFRPAAEAKALALTVSFAGNVPPVVCTDALRLRQILSNLLSNAIKFTARGEVAFSVDWRGEDRLCFQVRDTGVGISPAALGRLFAPYTQADPSVARRYGGTGLGLSISKRLAELLGGGIGVESREGAGSTFTVELRVRLPAPIAG